MLKPNQNLGIQVLVAISVICAGQSASAQDTNNAQVNAICIERPNASPAVENALGANDPVADAKFQLDRDKINSRIAALKDKGMGVRSYSSLAAQMDTMYSRGDRPGAQAIMADLQRDISELEARRREAQAINVHAQGRVQMVGMQQAGVQKQGTASAAPYNGSMDGFFDEVVNSIVSREVGRFVPQKGPFFVERFRIAQRVHQLEEQRVRVDGYASLFRQVEELAATRDSRRTAELTMNIRYLQKQLGLNPLEGSLHRDLKI